jgi:hypothetical protein
MFVELSYIISSLLLAAYSTRLYIRQKKRDFRFFALAFTFLALSIVLQMFSSSWWVYITQFNVDPRALELVGFASFLGFIASVIMAMSTSEKSGVDRITP